MLKFFGRGAGFSDEHNGAYFTQGDKLILLDCPLQFIMPHLYGRFL